MALIDGMRQKFEEKRFPDLKIPDDFRVEVEILKGMEPGSSQFAGITVNDEIRIRYLQRQLAVQKERLEAQLKHHEIRLKSRIHSYARSILQVIQTELTENFKLLFVQLDHFHHNEVKNA